MISQDAVQAILGIKNKVSIKSVDMVNDMAISFYPQKKEVSENILKAEQILRSELLSLGVKEIPYDDIFIPIPAKIRYKRRLKLYANNIRYIIKSLFGGSSTGFYIDRKTIGNLTSKFKYRSGVCIIVPGVLDTHDLPMQYIKSFKDNSIISILDFPTTISETSSFEDHFDASMAMFAYNMSNIVLAVDSKRWMIYNFNASHPIFQFENKDDLNYFILNGLIPKVVAPISPHRIQEFTILKEKYNPDDELHSAAMSDLTEGSKLYGETNLFPKGKNVDDLNFRSNFHKQIGKIHLDSRNGMSFGYIAKQLKHKVDSAKFIDLDEKENLYQAEKDYRVDSDGHMHVLCEVGGKLVEVKVPEVWVLTLRSGSNKTNFNPKTDVVKMGIQNGGMKIQLSKYAEDLSGDYKPSFDTKVILALAIGNAINASIAKLFNFSAEFVKNQETEGCSLSHWHGYFKSDSLPEFTYEYGRINPHVACSSPQSAIYALDGKLKCFRSLLDENKTYVGDIHVEPHHGSNICYPKLVDLVNYIIENRDTVALGNKYL